MTRSAVAGRLRPVAHRDHGRRRVRRWEGDGEPSRGVDRAGEHRVERGAGDLPGVPGLEHRGDRAEPWHEHRAAGVDDDDGAGVRRRDRLDQLVLVAGERERRPVEALAVALSDDDDRRRGAARRADRLLDQAGPPVCAVTDGAARPSGQATVTTWDPDESSIDFSNVTGSPDDVRTFWRRVATVDASAGSGSPWRS